MKRLLFLLAGVIFLCNCNREESSKVVILVTTNDTLYNVKSGDSLLFHIHSSAVEDVVKNVTISSFDLKSGSKLMLDTLLNVAMSEFDYRYIVPEYKDTANIQLVFTAFSQNNTLASSYTTSLTILVKNGNDSIGIIEEDTILSSYNSLVFSGCHSYDGQTRFFNLKNLESMSNSNPVFDSSLMDIVDICGNDTIYLSREWTSFTGVLFVRFIDLNFDIVSKKNLINSYNIGTKHTSVQNLQQGDIILIGKDTAIGVVKITNINDWEREYVFDYKQIE